MKRERFQLTPALLLEGSSGREAHDSTPYNTVLFLASHLRLVSIQSAKCTMGAERRARIVGDAARGKGVQSTGISQRQLLVYVDT
jgi:hypothetical protein